VSVGHLGSAHRQRSQLAVEDNIGRQTDILGLICVASCLLGVSDENTRGVARESGDTGM